MGNTEISKILEMKSALKKSDKKVLFSDKMPDDELMNKIFIDMANLALQESRTKWMHIGSMLSL